MNARSTARKSHATAIAALQQGQLGLAETALKAAITNNGADVDALHLLGVVMLQSGRAAEAERLFGRVNVLAPESTEAWVNLGVAANQQHAFARAISAFETALAQQPQSFSAHINLATAYHATGRLDEAVAAAEAATVAKADSVEAWNNLGNFYKDQGRVDDALAAYDHALAINPMRAEAFSNKLAALKLTSRSSAEILREHQVWSAWFEAASSSAPLLTNSQDPDRPLNIGYVSPDCHTALPAFLDPVWRAHDPSRFKVFAYFNNPQDPARLQSLGIASQSRVMRGLDDAAVAAQILRDEIDVLIDIAGHTGKNRLGVFARKPAPIQITWLDYLSTTGLVGMDYRIADQIADPDGNERFHSEALLRLAPCQWCWQPDPAAPAVAERRDGELVFGSFNNAAKLTDHTLARWARLLIALPHTRLVVVGVPVGWARTRIARALAVADTRLSFLPRLAVNDYRAAFAEVDIALDPTPFSGATTTLDALWQGVPVLTMPGETAVSRSAASLLAALGLTEWIAADEADFIAQARRASADRAALAQLRVNLRARLRHSPLLDASGFTTQLEGHFRSAWRTWCVARASPMHPHQRLIDAQAALLQGQAALACGNLVDLVKSQPEWMLAKQELTRAALAWAREHPEVKAAWQEQFVPVEGRLRVAVIICSIRPAYFAALKKQLKQQFTAHDLEVIGIHDATSLAEGYNRGAAKARGEVLIFCHDDIEIVHRDFGERLLAHLATSDLVGVVGSARLVNGDWSHAGAPFLHGQIVHRPPQQDGFLYFGVGLHADRAAVAALDGVFIACRRAAWETLRFDATTFDGFHLYDIDFSARAAAAGLRVTVALDLLLIHFSTGRYDTDWQRFHLRFLAKHPHLTNLPARQRDAAINVKLPTLAQVERLHAALRYHRFGGI